VPPAVTEGAVISGRYRLDRVIGRGGMADVYAGHDQLLDRPVAVKVPLPGIADDDRFQRRFAKEARAAAALNHPNVVAIFDRGTDGDVTYLVMELVTGASLRQLIDTQGFTEEEALTIAREVCAGLAYAHEQGFVHRDLKPDNVLITEDGVTKVSDFGIVRAIGDRSITSTRPLGSVAYVSPEQATGRDVDARSDLYSLGVVLFEMLTGTRPFEADSPVSIALAHIEKPPPSVRAVVKSISPEAAAVVERALAKSPDDRFPSADEMRAAIDDVLGTAAPPETAVLRTEDGAGRADAGADAPTVAFDTAAVASVPGGGAPAENLPAGDSTEDDRTTVPPPSEAPNVDPERSATPSPSSLAGDGRQRAAVGVLAILAVLVLSLLAPGNGAVRIPDVVGLDGDSARAVLAEHRLGIVVVGHDEDVDVPPGTVTTADPPAGTSVRPGGAVKVRLARPPEG
jgi:serine/threonine protein kinase